MSSIHETNSLDKKVISELMVCHSFDSLSIDSSPRLSMLTYTTTRLNVIPQQITSAPFFCVCIHCTQFIFGAIRRTIWWPTCSPIWWTCWVRPNHKSALEISWFDGQNRKHAAEVKQVEFQVLFSTDYSTSVWANRLTGFSIYSIPNCDTWPFIGAKCGQS